MSVVPGAVLSGQLVEVAPQMLGGVSQAGQGTSQIIRSAGLRHISRFALPTGAVLLKHDSSHGRLLVGFDQRRATRQ